MCYLFLFNPDCCRFGYSCTWPARSSKRDTGSAVFKMFELQHPGIRWRDAVSLDETLTCLPNWAVRDRFLDTDQMMSKRPSVVNTCFSEQSHCWLWKYPGNYINIHRWGKYREQQTAQYVLPNRGSQNGKLNSQMGIMCSSFLFAG